MLDIDNRDELCSITLELVSTPSSVTYLTSTRGIDAAGNGPDSARRDPEIQSP